MGRPTEDIFGVEYYGSAGGWHKAHNTFKSRCFTRAIAAQQYDDFTGVDLKTQIK
jgi:hypothetical protein